MTRGTTKLCFGICWLFAIGCSGARPTPVGSSPRDVVRGATSTSTSRTPPGPRSTEQAKLKSDPQTQKSTQTVAKPPSYRFFRPPVEVPLTTPEQAEELSKRFREELAKTGEPIAVEPRIEEIKTPPNEVATDPNEAVVVEAPRRLLPLLPPTADEVAPENVERTRADVVAPDWPAIELAPEIPAARPPARLELTPREPIRTVVEKPVVDQVTAPAYPDLKTVPTVEGKREVSPIVPPAIAEKPWEERREEIRAIVRDAVREMKDSQPKFVPSPPREPEKIVPNDSPLVLAIRAYQSQKPDVALEHLKKYDPANQEILLMMMPIIVRLGESSVASMTPDELAEHLDRIQGVSGLLKPRAALKADTVCFCRRVQKFGKFDPLPSNHMHQAGESVELYFELKNFTWQQVPSDRTFAMRLGSSLEIRDSSRRIIWRKDLTTVDSRLTPPSDYYLVYRFALPELPPGAYTLDVQVVDQLDPMRRHVRRSLDFSMGSRP